MFSFFVSTVRNCHAFSSLKQQRIIILQFYYICLGLAWLSALSPDWNQGVSRAVSLSGGSEDESDSWCLRVVVRIQFLAVVVLRSQFHCRLLARDYSQLLHTTCISWLVASLLHLRSQQWSMESVSCLEFLWLPLLPFFSLLKVYVIILPPLRLIQDNIPILKFIG